MEDEDVIIINECDCGCGCGDVELHSEREPDVLLFDEYVEPYYHDIVVTREAAEETRDYVKEKAAEIIEKENLLLDDHQTIKRELRQGFADVLSSLASEAESIRTKVSDKATQILNALTSRYESLRDQMTQSFKESSDLINERADSIQADIAEIDVLEECSEADIYAIFDEEPPHEKTFDDIPVVDGYMELEGFEEVAGFTPIYKEDPITPTSFDDVPVDEDGYMDLEGFLAASGFSINE